MIPPALIGLHASFAALSVALLAAQFRFARPPKRMTFLVSLGLLAVMASGLGLMILTGGLPYALFFGHVMHWFSWLAVLTWLHALSRAQSLRRAPKGGWSLILVLLACVAGLLALVQQSI